MEAGKCHWTTPRAELHVAKHVADNHVTGKCQFNRQTQGILSSTSTIGYNTVLSYGIVPDNPV